MFFEKKKKLTPPPAPARKAVDVFLGDELKRTFSPHYPTDFEYEPRGPVAWPVIVRSQKLSPLLKFIKEDASWLNGAFEGFTGSYIQFYIDLHTLPEDTTATGLNAFNQVYSDAYRGPVSGKIALGGGVNATLNNGCLQLTGRVTIYLALNYSNRRIGTFRSVTILSQGGIKLGSKI